ncbi:MAG: ABC transporter ATP-binding protein [Planctomycetes bacterium]|nr:ABC transporter ATP-binding protein [Planctomycetota bacterium]
MAEQEVVLAVEDLQVQFRSRDETVYAVNGISFDVKRGEVLGVVGESGCGKSISMLSVIGLLPKPHGHVSNGTALFKGKNLFELSNQELTRIRGNEIAIVFQDPMVSFNPVYTIGNQLTEALMAHKKMFRDEAEQRAREMLRLVGITNPEERLKSYPHQFSGGMRQRAMIAMALICNPDVLIADEPTTALDVTIEAQIVDLVKRLQGEFNNAIIWITHDLGLLAGLADRVVVMYGGFIVEASPVDDLYENPLHPYTIGLLNSLPRVDGEYRKLESIDGMPPILREMPSYCPFANRCKRCADMCRTANPPLHDAGNGHMVACWNA